MNADNLSYIIKDAETIVIKIGSVLVKRPHEDAVRKNWFAALAEDIFRLTEIGKKIVIVSSGGIALGRSALKISHDAPSSSIPLARKQAASAVGQYHLFAGYYEALAIHEIKAAQVLLTLTQTEDRRMYINARATLNTLIKEGLIPVINENDTVSTREIRFGDNDKLAAHVAQMIDADLVVLLSTIDGLYTSDPTQNKNAQHIPVVKEITKEHIAMGGDAASGLSTGGMKSKISAAISAGRNGIPLVIANGMERHALGALLFEPEEMRSTLFLARDTKVNARKRWIQAHLDVKGAIFLDEGARKALKNGKSLLPVGVESISGEFERGDVVALKLMDGKQIGVGVAAYGSWDAEKIMGHQSHEIESIIGYAGRGELIHRNDMVLSS